MLFQNEQIIESGKCLFSVYTLRNKKERKTLMDHFFFLSPEYLLIPCLLLNQHKMAISSLGYINKLLNISEMILNFF